MTSMTNRTSRSHPGPTVTATTRKTSRSTSFHIFTQRPNVEMETPEHKTLNNALVTTNEVLNSICKYSVSPPYIHHTKTAQDNRIILFKGLKLENQHTRMTLRTLSWVYKTSNYLRIIGPGSPCWSYQSQDLRPAKTERH